MNVRATILAGLLGAPLFAGALAAETGNLSLVDAAKLRPVVETVLPLSDARRAHEISQNGHLRGKIVLRVV